MYPKHHNTLKVILFIVVNRLKIQGFYSKFTSLSLKILVKVIFQKSDYRKLRCYPSLIKMGGVSPPLPLNCNKTNSDMMHRCIFQQQTEFENYNLECIGCITKRQGGWAIVKEYCIVASLSKSESFQALVEWVNSRTWITSTIWITLQMLNFLYFCKVLSFPLLRHMNSSYFDVFQMLQYFS